MFDQQFVLFADAAVELESTRTRCREESDWSVIACDGSAECVLVNRVCAAYAAGGVPAHATKSVTRSFFAPNAVSLANYFADFIHNGTAWS